MAILSDYEEEDKNKPAPPASGRKQFSAALDPSDPLGFLEKIFEFVAKESDLFKSDSLVNDVNAVLRIVKDKVEANEMKGDKVNIEEKGKSEKKIKEEATPVPTVKKVDLKRKKDEEEKERTDDVEEKTGPRAPNKDNGLDMDKYAWGQSLQEVNITVPVPPGTKSRFIICDIKKNRLKVGIKG